MRASDVEGILLNARMQVSRLNCAFIFVKDAAGGVAVDGGERGQGKRVGAREEGGKRDRVDLGLPSFQVPCPALSLLWALGSVLCALDA